MSSCSVALVRVEEPEDPARYGEWFQATIVPMDTWFSFHVCAKSPATCRGSKGHPDLEFHLESLRSIPLAELGTSQQPAWLAQPAAAADLQWELIGWAASHHRQLRLRTRGKGKRQKGSRTLGPRPLRRRQAGGPRRRAGRPGQGASGSWPGSEGEAERPSG